MDVHHRGEEAVRRLFRMGFAKCAAEELYDLRADPDYMINLAADPAYAETRQRLSDQLISLLREQQDPRVVEEDCRFERPPFAGIHRNLHSRPDWSGYVRHRANARP